MGTMRLRCTGKRSSQPLAGTKEPGKVNMKTKTKGKVKVEVEVETVDGVPCPVANCPRQIEGEFHIMCDRHWGMVPLHLQVRLSAAVETVNVLEDKGAIPAVLYAAKRTFLQLENKAIITAWGCEQGLETMKPAAMKHRRKVAA